MLIKKIRIFLPVILFYTAACSFSITYQDKIKLPENTTLEKAGEIRNFIWKDLLQKIQQKYPAFDPVHHADEYSLRLESGLTMTFATEGQEEKEEILLRLRMEFVGREAEISQEIRKYAKELVEQGVKDYH